LRRPNRIHVPGKRVIDEVPTAEDARQFAATGINSGQIRQLRELTVLQVKDRPVADWERESQSRLKRKVGLRFLQAVFSADRSLLS